MRKSCENSNRDFGDFFSAFRSIISYFRQLSLFIQRAHRGGVLKQVNMIVQMQQWIRAHRQRFNSKSNIFISEIAKDKTQTHVDS